MYMGKYVSISGYGPLKPKLENPSVGVTGGATEQVVLFCHDASRVSGSQSVRDTCVSSYLSDNLFIRCV